MANLTRRAALRSMTTTALAATIATAPAAASIIPAGEPDRALYEAIRDWRAVNVVYLGIEGDDWDDIDALTERHAAAVLRVFDIVPCTASGLRALCEFGAELMSSQHTLGSDMGSYTPAGTPAVSGPSAEEMFITALNRAAATLLPAAGGAS